jgi:small-conductance mechanosensitive channel
MGLKPAARFASTLGFILLVALLSACDSSTATPVKTPTVGQVATATAPPPEQDTVEPEAMGPSAEVDEGSSVEKAEELVAAAASRTPVPTPTPDIISQEITRFAEEAGFAGQSFLGLTVEDWIDLVISLLVSILGYLLAIVIVKLLFAVIKRIVRHTSTKSDDAFLEAIESELKWLVMIIFLHYALLRLDFLSDGLRTLINDIAFVIGLALIVALILKLIQFFGQQFRDKLDPGKDKERLEPMIMLLQRSGYGLVIIVGVSVCLSHFGLEVTALSVILILVAFVLSFSAKDIISDAITGFIILLDQPFRVGDVIEIEELNKWGEVVDIGTRTTRIVTRDNRFVIVPNSKIGDSQIINYTFPDPTFRVYSEILVPYGSDFDQVRHVAIAAVRTVEGVLPEAPVDVLFNEYGLSARKMRVRWWIDNMHREKRISDQVNEALEIAFAQAGIGMPVTTRSLIVQVEPETTEQYSLLHRDPSSDEDQLTSRELSGSEEGK